MSSRQREFYIRHDFSYYDSGLLALLSPQVLLLYDLLRRYVWRSEHHGQAEVRELLREGLVIAHIKQSTLATALGYTRRQTICENMAELKRLGWVKTHMLGDAQTACFVLGDIVFDQNGRRHEVFFADAFLNDLADRLDARAQREGGSEASLLSLPMEERIEITRAFLEAARESAGVVREHVPACTGSADRRAPASRTQEVGPFGTTKNEGNSEIEPGGSAPLTPRHEPLEDRGGTGGAPRTPGEGLERGRGLTASQGSAEPEQDQAEEPQSPEPGTKAPSTPPPPAPGRRGTRVQVSALDPSQLQGLRARYQGATAMQAGAQTHQTDVAEGRRTNLKEGKQRSVPVRALMADLETHWMTALRARYPGVAFAPWGVKEKGKIDVLLKGYGETITRQILTYAVDNWDEVVRTRFKGKPTTLSLALVVGMHETLSLEAQRTAGASGIKQRVEAWYAANPNTPLPEELAQEYAASGA